MKNNKKSLKASVASSLIVGSLAGLSALSVSAENLNYTDLGSAASLRTNLIGVNSTNKLSEMECGNGSKTKTTQSSGKKEKTSEGKCGEGKCGGKKKDSGSKDKKSSGKSKK